jgi:hypothetical protein
MVARWDLALTSSLHQTGAVVEELRPPAVVASISDRPPLPAVCSPSPGPQPVMWLSCIVPVRPPNVHCAQQVVQLVWSSLEVSATLLC